MAFHGHTKIELHNVKTGENKVIEKHNIFTNYLSDIMRILPMPMPTNWMGCYKGSNRYGATQWNNQANANGGIPRITDVICGGILCLENEREENPNNYFLTGNDVITARGANIANASEDTQLGSYNADLEKSSDTSKTMVWDFAQNQGNGTISTIGLTNIGMALCGLGGTPSSMKHTEAVPFGDVCLAKNYIGMTYGNYDDDYPTSDATYHTPIYCSLKNNTLISFLGIDSKVLHLRYYDMNANTINPLTPVGYALATDSPKDAKFGLSDGGRYSPTKRVTFDLSSYSFTGYSYLNMHVTNDGIMYICPTNTYQWKPNATMTFVKIDLINQKILGTCTVANTSGVDLQTSPKTCTSKNTSTESTTPYQGCCHILNNYFVLTSYNTPYRTFAINLDNSTDVKEIFTEEGDTYALGTYDCDFTGRKLYAPTSGYTTEPAYIVDVNSGIAYRVRTGYFNEYFRLGSTNSNIAPKPLPCDSDIINLWIYYASSRMYYRYNEFYVLMSYKQDTLSTINVLDEPVIKTADMTMRITYTISLEE